MIRTKINKLDIARWILLLPVTLIFIVIYSVFVIGSEDFLSKFYDEYIASRIIEYLIMVFVPIIIALCGYFIAPKFKFITVLVMMLITAIPAIESFMMDNRIRDLSNISQIKYITFINPLTIIILLLLIGVYKIESRNKNK
jgi:hypothetical protein